MINYKCASCGKIFNPEKHEVCPRCGDAASPSVLTRIERKRAAQWLRSEGNHHYDEHCHDDDAWNRSYGAGVHRAAVQSHEASLRAGYAAHQSVDNPTRLSNANPATQNTGDNPTRLSNANPVARPAAGTQNRRYKSQNKPKTLGWIAIAWFIYIFIRMFLAIIEE